VLADRGSTVRTSGLGLVASGGGSALLTWPASAPPGREVSR
jgi:hypothetical protein